MITRNYNGSEALDSMRQHRAKLDELLSRLHHANAALRDAARPLNRLSELDFQERRKLGSRLRATIQKWEQVTVEIHVTLAEINTDASPLASPTIQA